MKNDHSDKPILSTISNCLISDMEFSIRTELSLRDIGVNTFSDLTKKWSQNSLNALNHYYTLRAEKKSYRTIEEYINSVKNFMEFYTDTVENDVFYKDVTPTDIRRYMHSIETRMLNEKLLSTSAGFRLNRWHGLNSFFEFAVATKRINKTPVLPDAKPQYKYSQKAIPVLSADEIKSMLEEIEYNSKGSMENRNLAIFMLAVGAGLKISAIIDLNLDDVDFISNTITYNFSAQSRKSTELDIYTANILQEWLSDRTCYFSSANTEALFVSQYGQRISYDIIRKMLAQYSEYTANVIVTPQMLLEAHKEMHYYITNVIFKEHFENE